MAYDQYGNQVDDNGNWTTVSSGGPADAWSAAVLGTALGTYVDRVVNRPMDFNTGPGPAYGMDELGRMYPLGQPAAMPGPAQARVNPTLLILVIVGVVLALHK